MVGGDDPQILEDRIDGEIHGSTLQQRCVLRVSHE
jgi:hypothetical protein